MWPIDMATLESLFLKYDHILQSFLRDSTNAISFYQNWAVLAHNAYVDKKSNVDVFMANVDILDVPH